MNKTNLSKQQTNQAVAELASQFNDIVIPKINWGASAIPAKGFAVWNDFGIAINGRDKVVFENTTGLMCDTDVQEIVYDLITYNIDGIQVANDEVSIGTSYHKVQLNLNLMPPDTLGRLIKITLRDSGNNSNLVIGSARISQDTLYKICEEN
jgi:hypothetical protein|nr:MAG TPA: hypothetical protein [Caudoviricetes sp.]